MPSLPTPSNAPAGPSPPWASRRVWVRGLCKGLPGVAQQLLAQMEQQAQAVGTQREMQERREAWGNYRQHQSAWLNASMQALQGALQPAKAAPAAVPQRGALQFELLSDDVVENKILASRMALAMGETAAPAFDTLRLRMQFIEGRELPSDDILRTETVCRHLVEQWLATGLQRRDLQRVLDLLQTALAPVLVTEYQAAHVLLDGQGVTRSQDVAMRAAHRGRQLHARHGPGPDRRATCCGLAACHCITAFLGLCAHADGRRARRCRLPARHCGAPMARCRRCPPCP